MKKLTCEEYVEKGVCIYCGYGRIQTDGGLELDGSAVFQAIKCQKCGTEWFDHYQLVGYDEPGSQAADNERLIGETTIPDNDFILAESGTWIQVNKLSLRVSEIDGVLRVAVYKTGEEDGYCISEMDVPIENG